VHNGASGPRAFFLTALVAQRDVGTGTRTLWSVASCGAPADWAAAGSAAAYPGTASSRGQARWMTLGAGAYLRTGIQIEDTGGIRIVPARGSCRSPAAS
jgi:hypothetical protein